MNSTVNESVELEPLLTIGIPTYNRPDKLEKCLNSVLKQATHDIEILVSDNSDSNDSKELVSRLNTKFNYKIKYIKNEFNIGLDRNFYNLVKCASGKYLQWLSDDDELIDGAIKIIVNKIKKQNSDPVFFFLNPIGFVEQNGERIWREPFFDSHEDYSGCTPEEAVEIFDHYITFVSAYCFNRKCWLESCNHEAYFGTNLYLTYALIEYLSKYRKTIIPFQPLVAHRLEYTGNFPALSPFTIELQNALTVHAKKCGLNAVWMRRSYVNLLRTYIFNILIGYKLGYFKSSHRNNIFRHIFMPCAKYAVFWYKFLPIILMPTFVFRLVQCIKRTIKKHVPIYKLIRSD